MYPSHVQVWSAYFSSPLLRVRGRDTSWTYKAPPTRKRGVYMRVGWGASLVLPGTDVSPVAQCTCACAVACRAQPEDWSTEAARQLYSHIPGEAF